MNWGDIGVMIKNGCILMIFIIVLDLIKIIIFKILRLDAEKILIYLIIVVLKLKPLF